MTGLAHKQEALRWAQFKIVAGGQRRYWRGVEAHLKADIATLARIDAGTGETRSGSIREADESRISSNPYPTEGQDTPLPDLY